MKTIYAIFAFLLAVCNLNAQTVDRSIRPSSAPAKEINIKDAQVFTLPNGLKVFLVEDKTTPIVYYSLFLDVEPALQGDKVGLHDVFSSVFGTATVSRTKEQLNHDIDLTGANIGAHRNGAYASFLKKYEKQALDIFADILLHPVFTQEEFDLNMDKIKTNMSSLGDDAGEVNQRISDALIYGKNFPAGEVITMQTIENVKFPDLQKYYNTYFAPNVSRLVIVGDVSLKDAKASAEKLFGKWKQKAVPKTEYVIPHAPNATTVAYAVKPGAVQSIVNLTYPVKFQVGMPDYEAARVMNEILGGSGGYLFFNLREAHSYTYGVYSNLNTGKLIGNFSLGQASVKAAVTDSSLYEIRREINRIITEPVDEKALKAAKTLRAGNFSRSLENSGTIAEFAINIDRYKLPQDYYKNYLKRLDAVTVADVQAAAAKYLKPDNAWIVVTGDQAYAKTLLPLASDNTIHYYDYDANPVAEPVVQKSDLSAEAIINNYVRALGGEAAINRVDDYRQTSTMSMMGQNLDMVQLFKKPDKSLIEMTMNGMTVQRIAFNGKALRMAGMGGVQEWTEGDEFDAMKDEAGIAPEMNYVRNGIQVEASGIEKVNGKDAYVLTRTSASGKKSISYFDVESGLKVKTVETVNTPMGEQQSITELSDYREVDGVKFPFVIKQNAAGMSMEHAVKSVEINKNIADSAFE